MTNKQIIEKLATEKNTPCVTISLNTHRTHPDNAQDAVLLKNLLKEAETRVIAEYGKRPVSALLEKLSSVQHSIDINHNLDSLHIYLSNDTNEVIRTSWPAADNAVHISGTFNVRALIKEYNRSEEYLILLLSQSGVHLYRTINDDIINEIKNDDFPFSENRHYNTHSDKGSDSKHLDDLVREFLNIVDKAVVKVSNETGLNCVVISTGDNHSRLMQVADKPNIYVGHANIDYNKSDNHYIAKQGWDVVRALQKVRRSEAIAEMKEAVGVGGVLTDLQEIYHASLDGRGELLVVHQDFMQPVVMNGERNFDLTSDKTVKNAVDDITSNIAWEVLTKKGRVFFTTQDEIRDLGDIVLKTRY